MLASAQAGVKELEKDYEAKDLQHFRKELADLVLIGVMGLHRMGANPSDAIMARATENAVKQFEIMDIAFFQAKVKNPALQAPRVIKESA